MYRNQSFIIFGLGKFGESIATELSLAGAEVLAVDADKERVHEISATVTRAVVANVCDAEAMHELGISNMDVAIVAITGHLDASILATIFCKEAGVPFICAKSRDDIHTRILEKVGADKIIIPEQESGIRIARQLLTGNIIDIVEISSTIRMAEIAMRPEWAGHTLRELDLRNKQNVNIIALRQNGEILVTPDPDLPLSQEMSLLIIADQNALGRLI